MDSNQGVPFRLQQDFGIQSPWASITPAKPAPVDDQMNQPPYRMGFLDLLNGNWDSDLFQSVLPPDSNSSTVPDYADQFPDHNTKCVFPGPDSTAVPACAAGQVQDLSPDSRAAAAAVAGLGYSGGVQGPQISGPDLWPGTVAFGDPSDGWQRTTHTNLMAYADAAAFGNRTSFFTPLLLSQIEAGGCRMAFAPDESSMSGNVMVSSGLSNFDLNVVTQSFFSFEPELDENASEPDFNEHTPIQPQNLPQNAVIPGRVNEMANWKGGCSPSQLSVAWLRHQGSDVCPTPGGTRIENFNQNIAGLPVELTPGGMAELESYASANVVKDDRYAQETIDTVNRYLRPHHPWTLPARLERKKPLQTHMPPEFINMDNRDVMPQYPWTPARTEKNRPLQTQTPTEFINIGNRDFMPQHPWTPANQEISRPPDTRMPPEIIDLVDDSPSEQNNWEKARKLQTSTGKRAKLCLLEPLARPPAAPSTPVSLEAAMPFESALVQQQQADTEQAVSSAEAIDQATTAATHDLLDNNGIDLNTVPQKKPKRRKHRPKVIREGKPVRTPKPATPMPKNPSGKRKYVRKNKTEAALENLPGEPGGAAIPGSSDGSRQEDSSQKWHYKRKNHPKNSPENPYSNAGGAAELESRHRNNAVRRQLDFNDEVTRDAYPRSTLMFRNNVECQYQEAYHASNTINTEAAVSVHQTKVVPGFQVGFYSSANQEANKHIRLPDKNLQPCRTESVRTDNILDEFQAGVQQAVGNLVPGFPIGLYSSVNQKAIDHTRLADKVQPCRTESMRTDQILDEFRIPENPAIPPQVSKRENMKKLARKSFLRYTSNSDRSQEPGTIQLDSFKTLNMPRKRRIGDYILDNNAQNLMNVNNIQAANNVVNLNQSHNARYHDTYLSQVYNKQGTEHENRFTLTTASSLMCTPSNDCRRHQAKSDTAKAFISSNVTTQLDSEDMLALVPYSHSFINSAKHTVEQNKLTAAPLKSFPCNYKQQSTKSRMKEKAQTFIHTNQEDLQGQKPVCYPLDDVIQMLRHLTLNKSDNLLVPYVPKKPRPRAKVDLDPETNKVWNRLMGKEVGEDQETQVDKEKWEEERRLFSIRVESFIKRMHLVQGDRRFSKWKGSVVDSVVGVFLTQNVSDHLSSSAFMALAARFPPKSRCKNLVPNAEESESFMKHEDSSTETVKGNSKWQEQISSDQHLHGSSTLVIAIDNEIANSNESFGSNSSDMVASYTKVRCVDPKEKVLGITHDSPDSESTTPITLTNINLTEAEDRSSVDDAGSSQNSSENPLQVADQITITSTQLLNCDVSDQPYSQDFAAISRSVPVADLYEIFKNCTQPLASAEVETYPKKQFDSDNNIRMDLNEAPFAEYISNKNESLFDIHRAVQSQLQNQNFDNQQNSAVPQAVFQSQYVGGVSDQPYSHFSERENINKLEKTRPSSEHTGNISEVINQQDFAAISGSVPVVDLCERNCMQPLATAEVESHHMQQFTSPNNLEMDLNVAPLAESIYHQNEGVFEVHRAVQSQHQQQNFVDQQNSASLHNTSPLEASRSAQLDLKYDAYIFSKAIDKTPKIKAKEKKVKKNENEKNKNFDWQSLRKEVIPDGSKEERSQNTMDSVDWEAVRTADVKEISQTIRERGMNNMLAERIKEFLNRLVEEHKSIDLEWLRKVEPGKAKDFLLSIRGLGLKSVECVRLLTLHNLAFPVDTNVGRICVRLGWVPLQPLPDSVQLHLLELYPILETIQKYLWPRLCKLDQRTLYELHYQLITFGKVFCTKSKPNCNACPMRGECKHFASAFASSKLKLTGPEEKSILSSNVFAASQEYHVPVFNPTKQIYQLEGTSNLTGMDLANCQPIIEEPASPEPECTQMEESEIEDAFYEDPDEIPTIKLNVEEFTQNLQDYMQANMEIQDVDMSSNLALVITKPEHASIPMPKLKNVSRLRTEHLVYEIPDSHPLLEGFEPRESDDPSSYLLAIWTAGETAQSTEPAIESCNSDETGVFCNMATCFTCSHRRELQAQIVRGTILIPCRTAMRGSFPLNGTYFQVNEVFADHDSSHNPIDVPREWIWNLPRRTVFFGTSVTSIFKGLTTEQIQSCFWRGFVCVRGFDRKTRAPRPLYARLHFPASKTPKNKQQEKGSSAKTITNNTSQKGSVRS